jgi:hypothetical protein
MTSTEVIRPCVADDRKVTSEDRERWFSISWDAIIDYALQKLPNILFVEKAVDAIARQLNKCRAMCPKQLRQWCYRKIDNLAAQLNRTEKALRHGTKDFRYEQHGEKCFIQLHDAEGEQHVWKIPADWLEQARMLWPVYVRKYPDGRHYVAKKVPIIQPDGSRVQKEVSVHRLFLGLGVVRRTEADAGEAESQDGSWLNFCDGNIRLIHGSDLLDHCLVGLQNIEATATLDWKPAKSKVTATREGKMKRYLNWHEKSVVSFLSGKYPDDGQNNLSKLAC